MLIINNNASESHVNCIWDGRPVQPLINGVVALGAGEESYASMSKLQTSQ